jgi:hypothetical protein
MDAKALRLTNAIPAGRMNGKGEESLGGGRQLVFDVVADLDQHNEPDIGAADEAGRAKKGLLFRKNHARRSASFADSLAAFLQSPEHEARTSLRRNDR